MKYSTVLVAAVFAAGASAQVTRADFPTCALACLQEAIAGETDCTVDDIACSCEPANNKLIVAAATPCVLAACQGDDITKTLDVSGKICAPGNNAGGAPAEESSAPASTSTATELVESTSTKTADVTSIASSTTAVGGPSTVYVTVCDSSSKASSVIPKPTGNSTVPTAAPPTFTGAAGKVGATLGSVAAFALAALAL